MVTDILDILDFLYTFIRSINIEGLFRRKKNQLKWNLYIFSMLCEVCQKKSVSFI